MMQIALTVEYVDGSEAEVTAKASDLIAFERHFDQPMTVFADAVKMRIEWLLWLAWNTFTRQKLATDDFDVWVDSVKTINVGESGE